MEGTCPALGIGYSRLYCGGKIENLDKAEDIAHRAHEESPGDVREECSSELYGCLSNLRRGMRRTWLPRGKGSIGGLMDSK